MISKLTLVLANGREITLRDVKVTEEARVLVFRDTRVTLREYVFRWESGVREPRFVEVEAGWLSGDNAKDLASALRRG